MRVLLELGMWLGNKGRLFGELLGNMFYNIR